MVTIKGPITIKRGDISKFISDSGVNVALPFTASGWKSTQNASLVVDGEAPKEPIKENPIESVDPIETQIVERPVFKSRGRPKKGVY